MNMLAEVANDSDEESDVREEAEDLLGLIPNKACFSQLTHEIDNNDLSETKKPRTFHNL